MLRVAALVVLAGCTSILGIEDLSGPGGPDAGLDAEPTPDAPIGDSLTLSGTASIVDIQGSQPLAVVPVSFVDRTHGASSLAVTDPEGRYVFEIAANGQAVDGYLALSPDGATREAHSYPPILTTSATFDAIALSEMFIGALASFIGEAHDPGRIFVMVAVGDAANTPVAGITVKPELPDVKVIYAEPGGMPSPGATETTSAGIAYMFNVPPDLTTISVASGTSIIDTRVLDLGSLPTSAVVQFVISKD